MRRRFEPAGGRWAAPAELIFRFGVAARNRLYRNGLFRSTRLPATVVSVGNLTVGGTGKTPVVIELARLFLERGRKVALLSRGYGRERPRLTVVLPPGEEPGPEGHRRFGDEPCLFRARHPSIAILLGANRAETGRAAIEQFGADLLLLDDGMQHRKLDRDGEVVVVHGVEPFGNGRMLPRGPLREPPRSIGRADLVLANGSEGVGEDLDRLLDREGATTRRAVFRYIPESIVAPGGETTRAEPFLAGRPVLAVSGIGNPGSFETTLRTAGAEIAGTIRFPDHHRFDRDDCERIRSESERLGALAVTTEKDRVRLPPDRIAAGEIHTLTLSLRFDDPGDVIEAFVRSVLPEGERH